MLFTLFSFTAAFAQVLVRGTVLDEAGETVIGASVMIKGTTQGTITDFDGKFSLNVPDKKAVLVISFIGYANQEVKVDASKPMSIVLKEDSELLDEVVVVGYQEVKKRDLTGSVGFRGESQYGTAAQHAGVFVRPDLRRTYCRCERVVQRRYSGRYDEHRHPW